MLAVGAGLATYVLVPLALLEKLRYVALAAAAVVLVLVLLPGIGREVNGSQRWISLAGITVQASELAKVGFVIYLAGYIRQWQGALHQEWGAFMRPLAVLSVLTFLLLLEPDFGAVVVLGLTAMGMLFMAGVSSKRYLLVVLVGVVLVALIAVAQPYRMARLLSFIDRSLARWPCWRAANGKTGRRPNASSPSTWCRRKVRRSWSITSAARPAPASACA